MAHGAWCMAGIAVEIIALVRSAREVGEGRVCAWRYDFRFIFYFFGYADKGESSNNYDM